MNTASAPSSANLRSVVKVSRPAALLTATSWSRPGSKIGISPRCRRAILSASLSTQVTDTPNSEKQAPETSPTYPVPIIAIRICLLLSPQGATAAQNGPPLRLFHRLTLRCSIVRVVEGRLTPRTPLSRFHRKWFRAHMMSQSVLVTGGAGYIGSHACKALARAGYIPVTYDNLSRGHRHAVRWGPLVEGEIADRTALVAALREHRVSSVMHFAAFAYVGESGTDPAVYYRNNVVGTLALLDAMREVEVTRLVFSSTCATYGLPERMPIAETTPQRPVNPYGETKLAIERALHWYGAAYGLRSVALRYFNAAGADPEGEIGERHEPETHLVPLVLQAALAQRACVDIYGTDYPTPD